MNSTDKFAREKESEAIFISIFNAVCFGPKMNNIYDILFW